MEICGIICFIMGMISMTFMMIYNITSLANISVSVEIKE